MKKTLLNSVVTATFTLACSAFAGAQTLPLPSHIVILIEENYAYSEIIGGSAAAYAPYINALAANSHTAVFTQSYALQHPSEPNYLDFFAGNNQGINDDGLPSTEVSDYPFTTPNLCAELQAKGKTFITYSEDLPDVGSDVATYTSGGANYARKHNPCANWVGTGTNEFSDTVNQPYVGYFPDSANLSSLPTVSYVVPNMTNDMHDGSYPSNITIGDTWFHTHLNSFLNWAMDNNTLFIITFDEDDDLHGNNIPTLFYGPMVKGGTYSETITHCNVLRTIEQIYGTTYAGCDADSAAITYCWLNTTGVNGVTAENYSFKVAPNPACDVINFNCDKTLTSPATIMITDELGRETGKYEMTGDNLAIGTAAYNTGMYFYKVINEKNQAINTGKFIINHN